MVVGGGVSGLACAYRLTELAPDLSVTVIEKQERTGGLIGTQYIQDCLVELGPDSILTEKPAALNLVRRLGLEQQVIATRGEHRGAYVVHRGRLEKIPDGFSMMAPSKLLPVARSPVLSLRGKARMFLETVLPRGAKSDESVGSFVRRRFGSEVLSRLAQPLMGGIYGTDIERLSLQSTMPRFPRLEAEHRSVTLGLLKRTRQQLHQSDPAARGVRYGLFISFQRGVQTLTDALTERLGERVRIGCEVSSVTQVNDQGFRVALAEAPALDADAVVVALPARPMAALVRGLDQQLSERLLDIPYGSTAAVTYCFRRQDIAHPLDAFGFVVPKLEHRRIIASTWASVKFDDRAPKGHALLRVFFGGDGNEELLDLSDEKLIEVGLAELRTLIGLRSGPIFHHVSRHPYAMPQYVVGHADRVHRIEQRLTAFSRLELAGNALYGVGIPDAIRSGETAAERIVEKLRQ